MKTLPIFIGGEWVQAVEGGTREILNPATNEPVALVADGTAQDAERAIAAARKAFDEGPWPKMRAQERASYLLKLADLIDKHADELASTETRNNGKPLREGRYDVGDAPICFGIMQG